MPEKYVSKSVATSYPRLRSTDGSMATTPAAVLDGAGVGLGRTGAVLRGLALALTVCAGPPPFWDAVADGRRVERSAQPAAASAISTTTHSAMIAGPRRCRGAGAGPHCCGGGATGHGSAGGAKYPGG